MQSKKLGTLTVPALCLGHSMGTVDFGADSEREFQALIARALDLGLNFFDSSDAYWNGLHESWLGRALGRSRPQALITSKFGNLTLPDGRKDTNGRPEYAIACCEASLKRLGTDVIDLYYLHRVDPKVPIEDTVGAMSRLVEQGKVRRIGICEAGAQTLERAHRVHPITALQTEYSLWHRQAAEDVLGLCRQLGIGFVGYSPLGRGLLTGSIQRMADLAPTDRRRIHPRFKDEHLQRNLDLVRRMEDIARPLGLSCAQLALAWASAQGPDIVPLTGTQRVGYLAQNMAAAAVALSPAQCAALQDLFAPEAVAGERYPVEMLKDLGI